MEGKKLLISKPKLIKKIGILIAFIIISIVSETFYRHPLFNYSLSFIENWQNSVSSSTITFFKAVAYLSSEYFIVIHIVWIYFISPLTVSFAYTFGMIFTFYMFNIMKIWYGAERPFWIKPYIGQTCDGGFGNPSGHSLCSVYVYLAINRMVINCKYIKDYILLKIASSSLFVLIILLILLSRIILGVHSINQILHGALLGIAVFYVIYFIIELDNYSVNEFKRIFTNWRYVISITVFYVLCLIIVILSFYLIPNIIPPELMTNLELACPNLKQYRKVNNDALYGSYVIFISVGCYYGLVFLWYINRKTLPIEKDNDIINWSLRWTNIIGYCKTIIINGLCSLLALLYLIPIYEGNYAFGFFLKVGIPAGLTMFLEYGLAIFLSLKYTERIKFHIVTEANVNDNSNQTLVTPSPSISSSSAILNTIT